MIKVAWICSFSNKLIREKVKQKKSFFEFLKPKKQLVFDSDFAQWNTNGISEMSVCKDVELHIICPVPYLEDELQNEVIANVYYHFFRDERISLSYRLRTRLKNYSTYDYTVNRKRISRALLMISPDIVHVIGAENIFYSKAIFDISPNIPVIVQLQTLINVPKFKHGYVFPQKVYENICKVEADILRRATYIGTTIQEYRNIILEQIKSNAKFLDTLLAVGPYLSTENLPKKYDCVYFSSNLDKAGDWAIEAFVRARKRLPDMKMVMIGSVTTEYRAILDNILVSHNAIDSVEFVGRLGSYSDVLSIVQVSKCALLPLKVDFIASTLRESMGLGIPTLSTITDGTPSLNDDRNSILLSPLGDHDALANNLVNVLTDKSLYDELSINGYMTVKERYSNSAIIAQWVAVYKQILSNLD